MYEVFGNTLPLHMSYTGFKGRRCLQEVDLLCVLLQTEKNDEQNTRETCDRAFLEYFQKNIFKILLSRYTNMTAMTSHPNALLLFNTNYFHCIKIIKLPSQYKLLTILSLSSAICPPIFMQLTGQNNGGIACQRFYWPEKAIDWPEPA